VTITSTSHNNPNVSAQEWLGTEGRNQSKYLCLMASIIVARIDGFFVAATRISK